MATSRDRHSTSGRAHARTDRASSARRHAPTTRERASRHASTQDERRRSDGARVSAHERQRRQRERQDSRQDRADSVRTWVFQHRRLIIGAAVLLVVVVSLAGPVRGYYVARRESEDLQAYYDQLSDENSSLDEDVQRLTSEDGIKDEARKRGYVEEGETSVEVEGLPQEDDSSSEQTDTRSALTKFLDALFGYTPKSYE